MHQVGTILFFFFLGLSVIVYGLTISVLSFISREDLLSRIASQWAMLNLYLLKRLCRLDYQIYGLEHLPKNGPVIVLSKHQSAWETIALRALLPRHQAWVLKKELLSYPFFGRALRCTGQIAIDRAQGKRALKELYEQGINALSMKKVVIIFPEGTRTPYGTRGKYHQGGALLAAKANVPVITVAHDAGRYWPKGFRIFPGIVRMEFAEPLDVSGMSAKIINQTIENCIEARMDFLRVEAGR